MSAVLINSDDSIPQIVKTIKSLIEKAAQAAEKANQFYIAAGQHLKDLKARWPDKWETVVRDECGIGRRRTYELIAIADGRTTVEKVRADKADSVRKVRALRSAQPEPAQMKVNGQAVSTDDFGPAAQEQIAKALEEPEASELETAAVSDYEAAGSATSVPFDLMNGNPWSLGRVIIDHIGGSRARDIANAILDALKLREENEGGSLITMLEKIRATEADHDAGGDAAETPTEIRTEAAA